MTLFRKLFVTYLLVAVLALFISSFFAGYIFFQTSGRAELTRMMGIGQQLADVLAANPWSAESLGRFQDAANQVERTQNAHVWLVDTDGVVRAASESAAPGPGSRLGPAGIGKILRDPDGRVTVERPQGHVRAGRGVPVVRAGSPVGAVILSPSLEAVPQVRVMIQNYLLYGSLVAAVVVAAISYLLSQRIARPVERVSTAARRVARGDFNSRVEWQSSDEMGRLAVSFNEMTAELERLETARKDLMATVSHELKGPLARISGYLEAIHDGIGGEAARHQHFEVARREVGRLTRLVNDLLDFSRLEAGRLKLYPIPCDLTPHLARAAEAFEAPAGDAGVALELSLPVVLPIVECEPERVEQVAANLLENALAHTPAGGRIRLEARQEGSQLVVQVTDTGPGLPPDELSRVWERFYKADPARTPERGRGFGLGLTIVKQLVELQNGQVFAESQPGRGSAFGFRLPLATPVGSDM